MPISESPHPGVLRRAILQSHCIPALVLLSCLLAVVPARAQLPRLILNQVFVDFATSVDNPLVKTKFNVYDPVGPTMGQFDTNVQMMHELNIETYRIELGWGRRNSGFGLNRMIDGTADNITYNYTNLDHMVTELKKQNVLLHGAYCYCPFPLQDPAIQQRRDSHAPVRMDKWKEIIGTVAKHYSDAGLPFGVNEVWNEADGLYVFYSGTPAEYQDIYRSATAAVLSVNPDATIAGPASAPELVWLSSFPEFVARENLPLDAYTFHHYGSSELGLNVIDRVEASLNRFPQLNTTAMVMDEWHSADLIEPWCRDDDVRSTYAGAAQLLHDFATFLTRPELTSVSWAWYMDPGRSRATCMGLITRDGRRKAVFNAWKIFGNMPVDRKSVKIIGPFEALASADEHNAGVVIWNRDPYQRRIDVHLDNLPFMQGDARVYRIDKTNASYADGGTETLIPVETFTNVVFTNWAWLNKIIPEYGTIYIEASDHSGLSELTPANVAEVLKVNHYYPARGTSSYADFDRKTWIARLGMGRETAADQEIGVVAEKLPDTLHARVLVEGALSASHGNNLLGLRIDYEVKGSYAKSVLYHGPYQGMDLYDAQLTGIPWGTKQAPTQVLAVNDFSDFAVELRRNAPAGWMGKAHISYLMRNAGPGTRAKFTLR